ncbi:MAG: HlyC/CorC family transporter [Gammaproteobacteria bacterium]
MNELPLPLDTLIGTLIVLLVLSSLFSATETGMMSLNRYRLRHLANTGNRSARRAQALLSRPDRLIGVILIGNNLVNIGATFIFSLLVTHHFGESPFILVAAPVAFTIFVILFSEVTPKTFAVLRPERVAFSMVWVLQPLLKLFSPVVYVTNAVSNGLLRMFGLDSSKDAGNHHDLSPEELRTIVNEASGLIPKTHQLMLLNILDLEEMKVEDIMVPRMEILGIDIDDDIDAISGELQKAQHTRLPLWKGDINNLLGVLHLRKTNALLKQPSFTRAELLAIAAEPYFVPAGTPLHTQLINFRSVRRRVGFVVDEYGDVLGLVTLEDILEEIVGEFTTSVAQATPMVRAEADGSALIDGATTIREINRTLKWSLPTDGPKTLNGLVIEHLEAMPESGVSLRLGEYVIEILRVEDNRVHTARMRHHPK